jgi:hypothetical protein
MMVRDVYYGMRSVVHVTLNIIRYGILWNFDILGLH